MSEEFKVAVGWYLLKHSPKFATPAIPYKVEVEIDNDNSSSSKGTTFSSEGPADFVGDILEHPDMLWTEDSWTDDKERMAIERIREQGTDASPYWRNHYEVQAGRYWHQFYQRNKDHFYKDRHYLHIVFPELQQNTADITTRLLEVGCGVGNAALPLLEINPHLHITAVDFAHSAIQILQNHITTLRDDYRTRIIARVNNVVIDEPPVEAESMDLVLCMFVLSAMSKEIHLNVFKKLCSLLKPGGKLLIRDYGRYDEAQLRFKKGSKLEENFYVRQDGTCSYFFSTDEINALASAAGFAVEELHYILRQYANRQQKKARYRVWIHAKLVKKS